MGQRGRNQVTVTTERRVETKSTPVVPCTLTPYEFFSLKRLFWLERRAGADTHRSVLDLKIGFAMRLLIWNILSVCVLLLPMNSWAESIFVPIFIDARTEVKLGPFPYDRAVSADAIVAFAKLGAKGVVLKFFIDQPKGQGDDALALAMTKLPVILQARCDDTEAKPNPLDARFTIPATNKMNFAVTCNAGWIPLPRLQQNAANVCFVDQTLVDAATMLESYQSRAVKSLYVCALELARKPVPTANSGGTRKVDLAKVPRFDVISLVDVLDGKIDRARVAGKIVVFGYEGPKAAMFDTAIGRISAHRVFIANLLALEMLGNEGIK